MLALAVAALSHLALLWWVAGRLSTPAAPGLVTPGSQWAALVVPAGAAERTSSVTLINEIPTGPAVQALPGSHTELSRNSTHLAPDAEIDLPGRRAALRGGGVAEGGDSWTGRRDRETFTSRIWNSPEHNRLPRHRTGKHVASPESIARRPGQHYDDRTERRPLARQGVEHLAPGGTESAAPGGPSGLDQPHWDDADPVFTGPAGITAPVRAMGRTGPRGQMLADRGQAATEAEKRGKAADTLDMAGASNETHPAPIEMTAPAAGGTRRGVAGPHPGRGLSARGRHSGRGTAASTSNVPKSAGQARELPSIWADRQHPYFRRMYQRLNRHIEFPRELALALEHGDVVVQFTLSENGHVSDLHIAKPSRFAAFDRTLVQAVRALAPFGRVPHSILRGRPAIQVRAPYAFRNPLIR